MVSKQDTMERLNKEKDYEDQLVLNLNHYFIAVLDDIKDITPEEKNKLDTNLKQISYDSARHSAMFDMLIQKVIESEKDNF